MNTIFNDYVFSYWWAEVFKTYNITGSGGGTHICRARTQT